MGGSPEHGDPFDDSEQDAPQAQESREQATPVDRFAAMQAEIDRLKEQNALISKAIPPREAPRTAPPTDPFDEVDWDAELFTEPKEALRKYGDIVREQTKRELRAEYTTNQGNVKFWADFYHANDDLAEDKDLVESTLNSNLDTLANMPVSDAIKKLADLTRTRIMRYARTTGERRRSRAVVEGANAPAAPAGNTRDDNEGDNVLTLGDIIRSRKERRRARSTAA